MQSGANLGEWADNSKNSPSPKNPVPNEKNKFVQLTLPNYFSRLVPDNVSECLQSSALTMTAICNLSFVICDLVICVCARWRT